LNSSHLRTSPGNRSISIVRHHWPFVLNSLPYAGIQLLVLSTLSIEKIKTALPVLPKMPAPLGVRGQLVKVGKPGSAMAVVWLCEAVNHSMSQRKLLRPARIFGLPAKARATETTVLPVQRADGIPIVVCGRRSFALFQAIKFRDLARTARAEARQFQKIVQQPMSTGSQHRLWVKLDAKRRPLDMFERHQHAVERFRGRT
jgi:hypothetical protein